MNVLHRKSVGSGRRDITKSLAGPEDGLFTDKCPELRRWGSCNLGVRGEVDDAQVGAFMTPAGPCAILLEVDDAATDDLRVADDLVNL